MRRSDALKKFFFWCAHQMHEFFWCSPGAIWVPAKRQVGAMSYKLTRAPIAAPYWGFPQVNQFKRVCNGGGPGLISQKQYSAF